MCLTATTDTKKQTQGTELRGYHSCCKSGGAVLPESTEDPHTHKEVIFFFQKITLILWITCTCNVFIYITRVILPLWMIILTNTVLHACKHDRKDMCNQMPFPHSCYKMLFYLWSHLLFTELVTEHSFVLLNFQTFKLPGQFCIC